MSIRIGIIGIGVMGEYHTRVYSEIERLDSDVCIVGIADVNEKQVENIAKKYGLYTSSHNKMYTDYNKLLDQKLDAVSICVPTSMHYKVAIAAIQKGVKHLLIEKPITENLNSANDIIKYAKDKGVTVSVGHVERFNPAVLLLKKIIDSDRLGNVVSISAKRVGSRPPRIKDTGVIIDLAVHDLDIICYLYGMFPTSIYSIANECINEQHEDISTIMMGFDKIIGIIETNWLTTKTVRTLNIVGSKAVAHLDYIDQKIIISEKEKDEEIKFTKQEPLMKELLHFIDVAKGKVTPLVTGNDGINALKLALAAIESNKNGNVINVSLKK